MIKLRALLYLVTRVYVACFVASLCLQVMLYSANNLRMVSKEGTSSTLGMGVVEECRGASCSIISSRMDAQTSSARSSSRGSCHCGSDKNKMRRTLIRTVPAHNYKAESLQQTCPRYLI